MSLEKDFEEAILNIVKGLRKNKSTKTAQIMISTEK